MSTPFSEQTELEAKEIIARYPRSRSALLPMLHLVQSVEGHVSQAGKPRRNSFACFSTSTGGASVGHSPTNVTPLGPYSLAKSVSGAA